MEEQQLKDSEKQKIKDVKMSPFDLSTNIRKGKGGSSASLGERQWWCLGQSALANVAGRGPEARQGQLVMRWCH